MTIQRNEQVRSDLNIADKVVMAVWDNFVATEPTYVLRDLIMIEIQKARNLERKRCASIVSAARHGQIDGDLRSLISRIKSGDQLETKDTE